MKDIQKSLFSSCAQETHVKANALTWRKIDGRSKTIGVVYFDQRTHGQKRWTFSIMSTKGSCKAHEEKQKKVCVLVSSFSNVFDRFRPCKCMPKHAFAGWNTQKIGLVNCVKLFSKNWWIFLGRWNCPRLIPEHSWFLNDYCKSQVLKTCASLCCIYISFNLRSFHSTNDWRYHHVVPSRILPLLSFP